MGKTGIILSGLPGKMITLIADSIPIGENSQYIFPKFALTGPNQLFSFCSARGFEFLLVPPKDHELYLNSFSSEDVVAIDFSQPDAVNRNAELYCKHKIPFIMGTTGGDRKKLEQTVIDSGNIAVIAPNMAYPVVLMQAMLEWASEEFPGALKDFDQHIVESHQSAKKDVSGTALNISRNYLDKIAKPLNLPENLKVEDIEKLGIKNVESIRSVADQISIFGLPPEHWHGHGLHTYNLSNADGTVELKFTHNIYGRMPYVEGTLKALDFLERKIFGSGAVELGKVYSMLDVMKGN